MLNIANYIRDKTMFIEAHVIVACVLYIIIIKSNWNKKSTELK